MLKLMTNLALTAILQFSTSVLSQVQAETLWPNNHKVAISLSYDDALQSQLDNAIPALDQRNLKASFYVVPLSVTFKKRLNDWANLAKNGHELGNHTLFHACKKSKPYRDWVTPHKNLDDKLVRAIVDEVTVANTLLNALDGESVRTFTPPCGDQLAKDGNYIEAVSEQFIAIKGLEDPNFARIIAPNNIGAQDIIDFIEKQPKNVKLINVLFHGVGGDYLTISKDEHNKFLDYLLTNKDKYWVDTYRNIMQVKLKAQ
ncbi:polysaccharide deacetylase family protein [Paraglaciecola sp. 2405UD69-4]|uniref:polysaccharide deacetylase family protein n=1 Tax=Paraglaciecola sp. 2405UD69-4 TaxID=3391836 RepID=UPI0039C9D7B9